MDAAEESARGVVCINGGFEFGEDIVEVACFDAGGCGGGVAVHWIDHPEDCSSLGFDTIEEWWEAVGDFARAHARDEYEFAGCVVWVEGVDEFDEFIGLHGWADFDADGVDDAFEELDVGAVKLAVAFADPGEMGGQVVVAVAAGDLSGLGLFVEEVEAFVRGVEIDA